MSETVNILEARNRFSELVERARRGEEVVIAKRGEPVARLLPAGEAEPRRRFDWVRWYEENPLPDGAGRRSEDIDRELAEERADWL